MRATFALLVDHRVHNFMRKLAVEIQARYRTGLQAAVLPAHITLKLPFRVTGLAGLEAYFDRLAASIEPFEIALTGLELQMTILEGAEQGVLWLEVEESPTLRGLHNRINEELASRFQDTQAPFDGPDYRFHATVALGGQPPDVYRRIYAEYRDLDVHLRYTATHIAMFYSPDHAQPDQFITCKILPLGV
jgi:2'-5' RNA ligase